MTLMHERPGAELLDTEAGEFKRLLEPPAPPDSPEAPRRWPLLVAAIVVVAVIIAGGVWWLLDSTVSQSDYDDLAAELSATREQLSDANVALANEHAALTDAESALSTLNDELEALETENASLADDLAAERAEATGLSADVGDLQATLESGRQAVEALVLMQLNLDSVVLDEMAQAGLDATVFNDLLAQLGYDGTIEEWAASWDDFDGAWAEADRAVLATDDQALIDLWRTWNVAEPGSEEEAAAGLAMYVRAYELMLERITPADQVIPVDAPLGQA